MSTIIEEIERMTVLDLVNLKKELEDRWGIAPAVYDPFLPPGDVWMAPDVDEEQTEFSVMLNAFGTNKIAVIKVVRELTNLGLKEAKDLVESAPAAVRDGISKDDAEIAAAKLRDAGGVAEVV